MLRQIDVRGEAFLNAMSRISARMQKAQNQISTGLRVSSVSDDPGAVAAILEMAEGLQAAEQAGMNLGRVKGEVDTAEGAVASAVKLMDRVRALGAQGASSMQTAESRANIAIEVGSILEQIGALAATSVEGRSIFSGDNDAVAPYEIDLSRADPIGPYYGTAQSTRKALHPNGSTFTVARTAQEMFDDTGGSVLRSILALHTALKNNDQPAITTALGDVQKAGQVLNGHLAFYGGMQNKVADALEYGKKLELRYQTQLSDLRDADLTEAILTLQQGQTQQQAALLGQAKIPRTSLFDFLG